MTHGVTRVSVAPGATEERHRRVATAAELQLTLCVVASRGIVARRRRAHESDGDTVAAIAVGELY